MKNIKNKYIEVQKNSPSKGGFSDIRIRFFVLSCITIIISLTPFLGFLSSSVVVMLFAFFLAIKQSEIEQKDMWFIWKFEWNMDRLYHNSQNADLYVDITADEEYEEKLRELNKELRGLSSESSILCHNMFAQKKSALSKT